MEFEKRINYLFYGILVLMTIYYLMIWDILTLSMKIAFGLIYVLAIINRFKPEIRQGEIPKRAELLYYISSFIIILMLVLVTVEIVPVWDKMYFLERMGFIMVDFSVLGMILFTFFQIRKKKKQTA